MKQTISIIVFLLLSSCSPSRKELIDNKVNVKLDRYPTGSFLIEINKKNFSPCENEKEFIKEFKSRLNLINELKLDYHIYFIDYKGETVAWAEKIWGYIKNNAITTFDDSYTLRKEGSQFIFKVIKHTE